MDNYNNDLWNPGIPAVAEGHMLGRVPVGFDTDSPTDWYDLELPNVTVVYPREMDIVWHISGDYEIIWDAFYNNGNDDSELTIDIYYSNDSGKTWGIIEKGVENNGSYLWENIRSVIFTENGNFYSTLSSHARIKVVATDYTINFMLRGQDISDNDFCPPVDCGLFTLEEIESLVEMGILDELECSTDSEDAKDSTALRDYGASNDDDGDSDDNAEEPAQDDGANNELNNNMVDSVQASI